MQFDVEGGPSQLLWERSWVHPEQVIHLLQRQATFHTHINTYGQFIIISEPSMHFFGLWEEARLPEENPCRHRQSILHRRTQRASGLKLRTLQYLPRFHCATHVIHQFWPIFVSQNLGPRSLYHCFDRFSWQNESQWLKLILYSVIHNPISRDKQTNVNLHIKPTLLKKTS